MRVGSRERTGRRILWVDACENHFLINAVNGAATGRTVIYRNLSSRRFRIVGETYLDACELGKDGWPNSSALTFPKLCQHLLGDSLESVEDADARGGDSFNDRFVLAV
jgi:hypothetical protein